MRAGWNVIVSLSAAAASAIGVVLNLLDVGETISGPRRGQAIFASFVVFVASVGVLLYRQRKEIGDLKASIVPKVQIVYEESGKRPYLQRTRLRLSEDIGGEEWRYRIGVRNLSKSEISRVRAVLEAIEPLGSDGFRRLAKEYIYPGQPLQAMGKPTNTDEFLLGVSGLEPSIYVDVVYDHLTDEGATGMICFAYATTEMPAAAISGAYRITIRVEGGGSFDLKTFIVDRDEKRRLRLRTDDR